VRWTIGFRDDRTAALTELQWVDPPGVDPSTLLAAVDVEVSTSTVLGPWSPLATWVLERGADGSVAPLALPPGTWARFLRFSTAGPAAPSVVWAMPATLRAFERPTDDSYRSILGEWGRWEPRAIRERLEPMLVEPSPLEVADDDPSTAQPLGLGHVVTGRVSRSRDVDWYMLTMPPDHDRLTLTLRGEPFVATEVKLYDAQGAPVELEAGLQEGEAAIWTAATEPGAIYRVVVEQSPVSTVFTYDSSGSMVRYLPFVADALRTFARGIVPGLDSALIMPFQDAPLLDDWSDDPVALQQAVAAATAPSGSSAAELAMLDALARLGRRTGTRAMVVLTDAETNSRNLAPDVLAELERLRPLVFAVHMGDLEDPAVTTHLMQDWAATSQGTYQLTVSRREIDRTFARIAAWLRRPAPYSLSYQTSLIDRSPGKISVDAAEGASVPIGGVALELVLDTSGSMNKRIAGVTRMAIARETLIRLVDETLPEGLDVALRTFKAGDGSCKTILAVPFGPLEKAAMDRVIAELPLHRKTRTPLGATLHAVGDDLAAHEGPKIVVFVTDGKETCKGDPAAEVERLVELGVDVALNIVGFALEDPALKADMEAWAEAGGGVFFDAQDQDSLLAGIAAALQAPFRVYDATGTLITDGVVGGPPVELPPGAYRVEVLSAPPVTFEEAIVPVGAGLRLEVGGEGS
jgi:Mg-chelatase subunit ChlD